MSSFWLERTGHENESGSVREVSELDVEGGVEREQQILPATLETVSRLFEPIPRSRSARRWAQLLCGVVLYGATAGMLVLAGLGLDPWDVLHQGLSRSLGLGIGTWAIIVSFIVFLGWLGLRQRLGVGTLVNAVVVGLVIDLTVSTFHPPHVLWARVVLLAGGVVGNGIATGLYIGAGLGPGARDGLTTGVASRGYSIRVVRMTIEAAVLLTGFLLGGTVGIGTVFYALAIGPITHETIPALAIDERLRMLRGAGRRGHDVPAADTQLTELTAGS